MDVVLLRLGEDVSASLYWDLSWQSPPPTRLAITLSFIRPTPSVVGRYFWVTLSCDRMILYALRGAEGGRPHRSEISLAHVCPDGETCDGGVLALMWNVEYRFSLTSERLLHGPHHHEDPSIAHPVINAKPSTLMGKGGIIRSQLNVTQKYLPTTDGACRIKN